MNLPLQESIFEKYSFSSQNRISRDLIKTYPGPLNRLRVEEVLEPALNDFILRFKTWVLCKKHALPSKKETWKCPANWWEHLKWTRFPKWFTDRWPIKFTEQHYTVANYELRICPHDNRAWDESKEYCHIYWLEGLPPDENNSLPR